VVLEWAQPGETRYLVAELGMTGLLLFRLPDDRYRKHTHVMLTLAGGRERTLCYWNPRRFGRIYLLDRIGLDRFLGRRFGCDPLTVTPQEFLQMVQACRGRLKALLMHQQRIAGIGNIYANEILFRARLHPYRIAARLRADRVQRLYDAMRSVLSEAIEDGGSSVRDFLAPDGTRGRYRTKHLVYEKTGLPCPAGCGRRIRRLTGERSSFYCPACQPSSR
jgi:formamidopyrimidine-DNA glycosylase